MNRLISSLRLLVRGSALSLALGVAAVLCPSMGWASDTVTLASGETLTGTIERDEGDVIVIRVLREGKEERVFLTRQEVLKIVRGTADTQPSKIQKDASSATAPASPGSSGPAPAKEGAKAQGAGGQKKSDDPKLQALTGRPTRVAVLNFGGPSSWKLGNGANQVGEMAIAEHFVGALPLLKKDNVDVVIIRVNSPGGYTTEVTEFHNIFREYKKHFRCAAWIEWGISAAAMSPWVFEEIYMYPEGALGGATSHFNGVAAVEGFDLEKTLYRMELASAEGKKHPFIARAMQIQAALSVNIDENGNVTYFQDETGQRVINGSSKVLTLTSKDAYDIKVSKGTAATFEELMGVMGISEWETAGAEATKFVDDGIRRMNVAREEIVITMQRYQMALGAAAGTRDMDARRREVGVARSQLTRMRKWMEENPLLGLNVGLQGMGWFTEQDRLLRDLLRPPQN
ncbi:MAG: hypothetical protein ACK55O_14055 [Phycisphaerales bacterium]|jgi:hypothetical protein|nr:hypothetical protein [Phycisphaeraceae bacterium]